MFDSQYKCIVFVTRSKKVNENLVTVKNIIHLILSLCLLLKNYSNFIPQRLLIKIVFVKIVKSVIYH